MIVRVLIALILSLTAAAAETPKFERVTDSPVALVADEITYDSTTGVVRARGGVEVYQAGRTLTADEIIYDDRSGQISAMGPITLRTESGETVYADTAVLDSGLRDGLIQGAKSVLANGAAKLSAVEAQRVDNRYNVLSKAVFSPCEVCAANPTPLWRIRARRIIHDEQEQEIHYENAYFDVMGVTVGFLPYFRHPSPEVDRATGILAPQFERDRAYGAAIKLPYYIVIDDQTDVTLTPFLSYGDGALLEVEARKLFDRGEIDITIIGGVTNYGNDARGARGRIAGFGFGRYEAADGVHIGFDLQAAADDPFLRRYDYTEADRLTSEAFVRAYDGPSRASVSFGYLQSLRNGEPQDTIPIVLPEISARYVFETPGLGGETGLSLDAVALHRESGRDVARLSLGADWSRQAIMPQGVVLRGFADVRMDHYVIDDDPALPDDATRLAPRAGVEARMPFSRVDEAGGVHIAEPIVQFVYAPDDIFDGDIPNEDSQNAEFDTLNLFETDRQPGFDRFENGARFTVGGRYERVYDEGFGFRAAAGRIFRFDGINDFSPNAGLNSVSSDYVAQLDLTYQDWAELRTAWRVSDDFGVERAEITGALDFHPLTVSGRYLFVNADPVAGSAIDRSEVALAAELSLDRNWAVGAEARRDLIRDRFVTAGAVLRYEDECAGVDIYARRRFTESVSAPRGTSVGVSVRLFGATGGNRNKASGACAYGASPGE